MNLCQDIISTDGLISPVVASMYTPQKQEVAAKQKSPTPLNSQAKQSLTKVFSLVDKTTEFFCDDNDNVGRLLRHRTMNL